VAARSASSQAASANASLDEAVALLESWEQRLHDVEWVAPRLDVVEEVSGDLTGLLCADMEEERDLVSEVKFGKEVRELTQAVTALLELLEGPGKGTKSGCCGGGSCGPSGGGCGTSGGGCGTSNNQPASGGCQPSSQASQTPSTAVGKDGSLQLVPEDDTMGFTEVN